MNQPNRPSSPSDRDQSGLGGLGFAGGAGLLMILCCAAPALIAGGVASGVLATVGAWAGSPWVIGAAVTLLALVVGMVLHRAGRSRSGSRPDPGGTHDRCPLRSDELDTRKNQP